MHPHTTDPIMGPPHGGSARSAPALQKDPRFGGRMIVLDGLRGLALAMVVLLHFIAGMRSQTSLERAVAWVAGYGKFGPELFFVLSGFLITGILYDARAKPHYFRNFYVRRILRIFPLYYLVLVLVLVVAPRLPLPQGEALGVLHERQAWAWTLSINLLTAFRGEFSFPYLDHFWSISVEEHFYVVWPFLVWVLAGRPRALLRVCAGVFAAVFAARIAAVTSGVSHVTIGVFTPFSFDSLCLGAFLAVSGRQPGGVLELRRWLGPVAAVAAVSLVTLFAVGKALPGGGAPLVAIRYELIVVLAGALLLCAVTAPPTTLVPRFFSSRPMLTLGKYSYGIYAFHHFFSYWFETHGAEAALAGRLGSHLAAVGVLTATGATASFALSVASYHAFEKPFLELKRYFAPGARPAAPERAVGCREPAP